MHDQVGCRLSKLADDGALRARRGSTHKSVLSLLLRGPQGHAHVELDMCWRGTPCLLLQQQILLLWFLLWLLW